jgi:hypothetical protein
VISVGFSGTDYNTTCSIHQYDGKVRINGSDGTSKEISISNIFAENEWHHYAFTYNGQILSVYKDGEYVS